MSITELSSKLGRFDAILMMGNNFGLFGSVKRARWLPRRFKKMTSQNACIIAESCNPYDTTDPCHLQYHRFNRQRGRMGGQLRIRIRYKKCATPWFDLPLVSREEMQKIVADTVWEVERFIDGDGSIYIAVIRKQAT